MSEFSMQEILRSGGQGQFADRLDELERQLAEANAEKLRWFNAFTEACRDIGTTQAERDAARLDVAECDKQLAEARADYEQCESEYKLWIQELRQQLAAALAAKYRLLDQYGEHQDGCDGMLTDGDCDCGFHAVFKRVEKAGLAAAAGGDREATDSGV
jgi:chromosome segregation ATPase